MKLLFDQNISFRAAKKLAETFQGCVHVSDCGLTNVKDFEIWEYAKNHDFIIVTFDSDFFDISLVKGHPPKIIWIRLGNLSTNQIVELFIEHSKSVESFINDPSFKDVSCLQIDSASKAD